MHQEIRRIVLIGAGNVATHLAFHLRSKHFDLVQIWSRSEASARSLALQNNTTWCTDLKTLHPDADLYMIAVPDQALPEILTHLKLPSNRLIVHTSGSIPIDILQHASHRYGVFYPVQTFSKERPLNFSRIPVCLEANTPSDLSLLKIFTRYLTRKIYPVDLVNRKTIHLAAIFASNFTNYLYQVSYDLLQQRELPFDLLKPIIRETAGKVQHYAPHLVQTGPAIRNDQQVISDHIEWLKNDKEYQELYSFLTRCILEPDRSTLK